MYSFEILTHMKSFARDRHMVHQQDFETQLESCMHIIREVDSSVAEFVVSGNLQEMKEQLANCQVCNIFFTLD